MKYSAPLKLLQGHAMDFLTPKESEQSLVGYDIHNKCIRYNSKNTWGFFLTWGLNLEIDTTRKRFLKCWKEHDLPVRGILPHDFLEPKPKKCWATAVNMARKEFESARPDGTRIRIIRLNNKKFEIVKIVPRKNGVKTIKSKMLFDPGDPDGPILFSEPQDNADIIAFMNEQYTHAITNIATHEARNYITYVLSNNCEAALVTQKGGMYYVDVRHTTLLKRLREFLVALHNRLGIFPIIKTTGNGDIDYFPLLQSIINYQIRRYFFKTVTKNIFLTLDKPDTTITIRLANKYRDSMKEALQSLKYYAKRFGLLDVYNDLKEERKQIMTDIKSRITDITDE
jgi:hypothetical protein